MNKFGTGKGLARQACVTQRKSSFRFVPLASACALLIASSAAQATTITFAPGDYDNTANTVTGTNATPVYNNNQTSGVFRDVFWYGTAYNGGTAGVGSPDFINSGPNLISNGGSPARATPGGDNTALNFTGQRIGSGNASFVSIYDTTPGDNTQSNLFSAVGGLELSADVLFAPGQHTAAGGIVALYNGGQDGLALLASNGGGNNVDAASLSLVFQQAGDPTALTSFNLAGATFLGDTNGAIATGSQSGDHWYRVVMNLSATGDLWSITGSFYGHTDATDPNSALGALLGSLTYSGSLSNPGNALDLTNPGQIGLMAYTSESFSDGLGAGGTGADPRTDNLGVSITNFTFPGGTAVPEPATWAMMIMGFGGIGALVRRRRGQALTA